MLMPYQEDTCMMVDMKEGKLSPSFLRDNKNSIQEIKNLGQIEDVQDRSDGWIHLIEGVTEAWSIASAICLHTSFNSHVRT